MAMEKQELTEDEKFELQLQAEQELGRLARTFTILDRNRAQCGDTDGKLAKQAKVLDIFRKEQKNILTDLAVASAPARKKEDERRSKELSKLLKEYDDFDDEIKIKKSHLNEIDGQIKIVRKKKYHSRKENEKKKKQEEKEQKARVRVDKRAEKEKAKIDSESSDEEDSLDDVTISEEEYCELDGMNNVSAGDYVLVKFFGGKRKTTQYRYVCVVQNVLHKENEIKVMSMKVSNSEKDVFRVDESDVSLVEMSATIGKLPSPEILVIGDRVKYQFSKPVDVFESK
ncbi:hypothetical protein JTB14_029386 [Gonioctena quinquepunctata]|nr:hypothetical protein JTB14_029386 [Gonioctena quinquepunctata]